MAKLGSISKNAKMNYQGLKFLWFHDDTHALHPAQVIDYLQHLLEKIGAQLLQD